MSGAWGAALTGPMCPARIHDPQGRTRNQEPQLRYRFSPISLVFTTKLNEKKAETPEGASARMDAAGKPDSVVNDHFSGDRRCRRSSSTHLRLNGAGRTWPRSGLALGGVYNAKHLAVFAVGSYPTLSPLPGSEDPGGLLSVALSLLRHPTERLGFPVALPYRVRTFLDRCPKTSTAIV